MTVCTIHSFQDHVALQNDLNELETWTKNWGMRFNSKKSYILSIHQNSKFFYTLNGDLLKQVEDNAYMDVLLSKDIKWHKYISNVTKKASQTLGFLNRNFCTCPIDCRRTAYLHYYVPSWNMQVPCGIPTSRRISTSSNKSNTKLHALSPSNIVLGKKAVLQKCWIPMKSQVF